MKLMIPVSLAAMLFIAGHADAATHAAHEGSTASCGKQGDAKHCQTHAVHTSTRSHRKASGKHTTAKTKSHTQHQAHAKTPAAETAVSPTEQ